MSIIKVLFCILANTLPKLRYGCKETCDFNVIFDRETNLSKVTIKIKI